MRASASTRDWLAAYYAAMDALDLDRVGELLADDVRVRYPSGRWLTGRDAVLERVQRGLGALAGIRHTVRAVWESGDEVLFELDVAYRRADGTTIERPGMGIFVRRDGLVVEQRLFVDASGVWDR